MNQSYQNFANEETPKVVYINTQGNHYKVWGYLNVGIDNEGVFEVVCFWGRIGSHLQTVVKQFPSEYLAYRFAECKVYEKMGKGYHEYSFSDYFIENQSTLVEDLFGAVHVGVPQKLNRFTKAFEKIDVDTILEEV